MLFVSLYVKVTFANDLKERKSSFFHTIWPLFLFLSSSTLPPSSHDNYQLNIFNKKKNQPNVCHQLPHKLAHKVSVSLIVQNAQISFYLRISWVFSPFSGPLPASHQHKRINMQYDKCSRAVCVFHLLTSVSLSACAAAEIVSVLHFLPHIYPCLVHAVAEHIKPSGP